MFALSHTYRAVRLLSGLTLLVANSLAFADSCRQTQQHLLDGTEHSALPQVALSRHQAALQRFYQEHNFVTPWLHDQQRSPQARQVETLLANAAAEGLDPKDYRILPWKDQAETAECRAVRYDVNLTLALMRYLSDLHIGRVKPQELGIQLDTAPKRLDLPKLVSQFANSEDVPALQQTLQPAMRLYTALKEALAHYRQLSQDEELSKPLAAVTDSVRPDEPYPDVARLRYRLERYGDYPGKADGPTPETYSGDLVEGVKAFQQRHGLAADGVLGKGTVRQLNMSPARRIQQLSLSMERLRWMPKDLGPQPLVVNVPQYKLMAFQRDAQNQYQMVLEMNAVVGRSYPEHRTPLFNAKLKNIVINPYWNVPYSIARKELYPKLRKNPGLIDKDSYELYSASNPDQLLEASDTHIAGLYSGEVRIRQRPGKGNTLGQIKFLFPNNHSVYLHGTSSQSLFSRNKRDFSHGCIRLESPLNLAEYILKDQRQWSREQIVDIIDKGKERWITLERPLDVYILYTTAIVNNANGQVNFFDDIYEQDQLLAKILKGRNEEPQKTGLAQNQKPGRETTR